MGGPYRTAESETVFHVAPCVSLRSGLLPDYPNGWPFDWGPTPEEPNDTIYKCIICHAEIHLFRDNGIGDRKSDDGPRVLRSDVLITARQNRWFPPVKTLPRQTQLCDGTRINGDRWFSVMERMKSFCNEGLTESEALRLLTIVCADKDPSGLVWHCRLAVAKFLRWQKYR